MIRPMPLAETISGQELIKDERVKTLTHLVTRKFTLSLERVAVIQPTLDKLDLATLQRLLDQVLDIDSVEELEEWIADHYPAQPI